MLGSLAFVPENDVISCFNTIMEDFPEEAIEIAKYFEKIKVEGRLCFQLEYGICFLESKII